jgi:hypothetical protein
VKNVSDTVTDFTVAAEIELPNGGQSIQLNGGGPICPTITQGQSQLVPFRFTVPYTGLPAGTYTAHVVVREKVEGSTCGDGSQGNKCGDGTLNFTVGANPAFTGRIAFQVYSSYLNIPVTNAAADGTIQLYTLPSTTNSLRQLIGPPKVQYAVNPKFSPDGSSIVFAGIPPEIDAQQEDGTLNGSLLQVFLFNIADCSLTQLTPNGSGRNEDPSFSPDGSHIVYKYTPTDNSGTLGQIYVMNLADGKKCQLTPSPLEQSAPSFSPTGDAITYFTGGHSDPSTESIYTVPYPVTASPTERVAGMESFYSSYLDENTILYTQWANGGPDTGIYTYTISSNSTQPLLTNMAGYTTIGVSDADAFAVNQPGTTLIGFSSTRPQSNTTNLDTNNNGNIVYLGDTTSGAVYYLPQLDPNLTSPPVTLNALGGTYTQYSHSCKLAVSVPATGTILPAGTSVTVQAQAWSDGGPWTGTLPTVTFTATDGTQASTTLQDSGTTGTIGSNAKYEIYTGMVTLPSTTETYTVTASAASTDNVTHTINASSFTVSTLPAQTLPGLLSQQTLGETQSLTLPADTSENLPVTYTVSGPAMLSGDTVTFTGTGTVIVTATQAGNGTYAPFTTTDTINVVTAVPAAPRWMLALLLPLLGFAASRARQPKRA